MPIVWQATHEGGNLREWGPYAKQDSGKTLRPRNGVTDEFAHAGALSQKMTVWAAAQTSGCRTFRHGDEIQSGAPYYYGAWYLLDQQYRMDVRVKGGFWNVLQFKSALGARSVPFWWVRFDTNPADGLLYPVLTWKGVDGPFATTPPTDRQLFLPPPATTPLPVGEWFHLEVFLRQSDGYDGRIAGWLNGVQLWELSGVRTMVAGGRQSWSVNNYGKGILPEPSTLYVDDVTISEERVGVPAPP